MTAPVCDFCRTNHPVIIRLIEMREDDVSFFGFRKSPAVDICPICLPRYSHNLLKREDRRPHGGEQIERELKKSVKKFLSERSD